MIPNLHSFRNSHTVIGIIADGIPALINALNLLVHRIAITIILQVLISIPLFYLHHNLFALGFVIGFVFDKQVREVVEKVNIVYSAQRPLLERVVLFGGGSFLVVLTMPTSMVIATLYYSAQWGSFLYQNSLARQRPVQNAPIPQDPPPVPPQPPIVVEKKQEEEVILDVMDQ